LLQKVGCARDATYFLKDSQYGWDQCRIEVARGLLHINTAGPLFKNTLEQVNNC